MLRKLCVYLFLASVLMVFGCKISGTVTDGGVPLGGVTVTMSGAASGTTTTSSTGYYAFNNLLSLGYHKITPSHDDYTFEPVNKNVNISFTNMEPGGINFVATVEEECSDGETEPCYTGPVGTSGVGECQDGTRACASGVWGACTGEVTPVTEICGDTLDNDCDGAEDSSDTDCYDCTDSSQCDDGNICNGVETCVLGSCQPGTQLICDDAVACTTDSCDPIVGCTSTPYNDACDDLDECTINVCDPYNSGADPTTGCVATPSDKDSDSDTYIDETCGGYDCNDGDGGINPGVVEICDDGVDNDCDGDIDCDDFDCVPECLTDGITNTEISAGAFVDYDGNGDECDLSENDTTGSVTTSCGNGTITANSTWSLSLFNSFSGSISIDMDYYIADPAPPTHSGVQMNPDYNHAYIYYHADTSAELEINFNLTHYFASCGNPCDGNWVDQSNIYKTPFVASLKKNCAGEGSIVYIHYQGYSGTQSWGIEAGSDYCLEVYPYMNINGLIPYKDSDLTGTVNFSFNPTP